MYSQAQDSVSADAPEEAVLFQAPMDGFQRRAVMRSMPRA